ncbi:MAG TPA: PQQ-dependent sugar dehydrogenase [Candidatus Limnocylindria bacterium]|nr:PQQ-dependent sugar dehydrogenase [Candidatus Limnocylindria bacterium]
MRRSHVAAAVVFLLGGPAARAEDVGARRLLVRDATRRVVQVLSTDPNVALSDAGNPAAEGAFVHVYSATDSLCVVLEPGPNWVNTGTKWKYRNPVTKNRALITNGKLKVTLKSGVTYTLADDGTQGAVNVQAQFGAGTRHCLRCTGNIRDDDRKFLGRNCPVAACDPEPASCQAATCGNGVVELGEECDDAGALPGDGCDDACQLESTNPAVCAGIPTVAGTAIAAQPVVTGLQSPVHVAAPRLDPSRIFVVEQPGRIRVVRSGVLLPAPFLAIEGLVRQNPGPEEGLLSVAFDPDYETNRFFYVYYNNTAGDLVISRFQANELDPDDALEASEHVIITIPHPVFANHNGGNLTFGPDGFLYAGTGDGGGGGDPGENAQNDASLLGKLLRIDVDTDAVSVWGKGLRNPFRLSFDRATGDLYIGDVGQGSWEEINFDPAPVTAGTNYAWDDMEGRHCFEPSSGCLTAGRQLPVLEYCNSNCVSAACNPAACSVFQTAKGRAVIGGFVYRGCTMPDLHGEYFYSDTYGGWIHTFKGVSDGDAQNILDRTPELGSHVVTSFGEDARGELYFTDFATGGVYKIVPN